MAVTGSGVFGQTLKSGLNGGIVLDLDLTTHKIALFSNSVTPNFDTNTAYGVSPFNANEITGTGYTAGGKVLSTATFDIASSLLVFDNDDITWTGATVSGVRCGLIYADALGGDNAIGLLDFGADFAVTADDLILHFNSAGIIVFDYA